MAATTAMEMEIVMEMAATLNKGSKMSRNRNFPQKMRFIFIWGR
jgi:hypothetical protein